MQKLSVVNTIIAGWQFFINLSRAPRNMKECILPTSQAFDTSMILIHWNFGFESHSCLGPVYLMREKSFAGVLNFLISLRRWPVLG